MNLDNTQWVCITEPTCACLEDETDPHSCECRAIHDVNGTTGMCIHCRERMILIDADSGEALVVRAS